MPDRPSIVSEAETVLKESPTPLRTLEVRDAIQARGNWPDLGMGATAAALNFLFREARIAAERVPCEGYMTTYWSD
jgi:hypothetical protein